jgi:hypothetical protein
LCTINTATGGADQMTIQQKLSLEFFTEDQREIQLAQDYWDGENNGSGWIWARTVRSVALAVDLTQAMLLRAVKAAAKATVPAVQCSGCQMALEVETRSDLERLDRTATHTCSGCRAKILAERERLRRLQEAAIWDRKLEIVRKVRECCIRFNYEQISYFDAIVVFGIFLASDDACNKGVFDDVAGLYLCASQDLCNALLGELFKAGILTFAEDCDPNSIQLKDDGSWSYFPGRMKWELAEDLRGLSRPKLMHELGRLLDLRDQHEEYWVSVACLWWRIGYDDVLTFLKQEEGKYRFPEPRIGEKTEEALEYALTKLPIPQVRRALKYAVKDAASYSMTRDVYKRQAMNSIPRNLISYVDRALSSGWVVTPVLRDWKLEEPLLLTVLFDRVLSSGMTGFKALTGHALNQQAEAGSPVPTTQEFCATP